jgi:hypothetical protein
MSSYEQIVQKAHPQVMPGQMSLTDEEYSEFVKVEAQGLQDSVEALAEAIAGPDKPGETYVEKMARLTAAKFDARSDLTREYLSAANPAQEPGEEPSTGLSDQELERLMSIEVQEQRVELIESDQFTWAALLELEQIAIGQPHVSARDRGRWEKFNRPNLLELSEQHDRSE